MNFNCFLILTLRFKMFNTNKTFKIDKFLLCLFKLKHFSIKFNRLNFTMLFLHKI